MKKNENKNLKTICESEFEKITNVTELLNFCKSKDTSSYKDLDDKVLSSMISQLIKNLEETTDKKIKEDIVQAMENILNKAPSDILSSLNVTKLMYSLKKNCIDDVVIDGNRVSDLFAKQDTKKINFRTYLMFIGYCKDSSVPQDIFNRTIDIMLKDKETFIKSSCLPFHPGISDDTKNKYRKYIFTPSLINFIKSKFNFDEKYNLEQVLKDKFEKENFVEDGDCDLGMILYRLCFESYISIPHKKEDIVELFKTTKSILPEDYKSLCNFNSDTVFRTFLVNSHYLRYNLYDEVSQKVRNEMDEFVRQIFKEKELLNKDNNLSGKLTLEDLKILNFSNFMFTTDSNTKDITKEKFLTLIPDKIDDKYYFRWLIEFYIGQIYSYDRRYFISLINRSHFPFESL